MAKVALAIILFNCIANFEQQDKLCGEIRSHPTWALYAHQPSKMMKKVWVPHSNITNNGLKIMTWKYPENDGRVLLTQLGMNRQTSTTGILLLYLMFPRFVYLSTGVQHSYPCPFLEAEVSCDEIFISMTSALLFNAAWLPMIWLVTPQVYTFYPLLRYVSTSSTSLFSIYFRFFWCNSQTCFVSYHQWSSESARQLRYFRNVNFIFCCSNRHNHCPTAGYFNAKSTRFSTSIPAILRSRFFLEA